MKGGTCDGGHTICQGMWRYVQCSHVSVNVEKVGPNVPIPDAFRSTIYRPILCRLHIILNCWMEMLKMLHLYAMRRACQYMHLCYLVQV